ncbi:MAG: DUF4340 domain-containing protein [Deltaproteobacteria bacterium]|nr:DUF4340 domain-containing protein [Deltaproteobacteria bacterium]
MNQINKLLGILLVVQVAIIGLTWATCQSKPTETGSKPVFEFKSSQVTAMQVAAKPSDKDKKPETVTLEKKKDKWVVASADDYPAKEESVVKVLDELVGLRLREPIANNPANHSTLHVGEKEYDRKVTLKTALVTKSIIAGAASGQSIHIRYQGDNNVYQVKGATVWSIPTSTRSYIETKYIDVAKDKLNSVMIANPKGKLSFTKQGDAWTLSELPAGAKLDDSKVKSLIDKASSINISEPIGKSIKPEYGLPGDTEVVLVSAEKDSTTTKHYAIGAAKGDQHYYLKADDNDYVVAISKYDANQLREKAVDDLIKKETADKKKENDENEGDEE